MLQLAVGYGRQTIEAKERAIYFYEQVEGKKIFKFVESQIGYNEIGDSVWVTTIWFEVTDPTPAEQQKAEEENYFIGSTGISPNDPLWREKLAEYNAPNKESVTVAAIPTVEFEVHHVGEVE